MLCYVMICYVMLCYVMLCYVMLCYVMLCYVMLCYVTKSHPLPSATFRYHWLLDYHKTCTKFSLGHPLRCQPKSRISFLCFFYLLNLNKMVRWRKWKATLQHAMIACEQALPDRHAGYDTYIQRKNPTLT